MRQCARVKLPIPTALGLDDLFSHHITLRAGSVATRTDYYWLLWFCGQLLLASNALGLGNYNLSTSSCFILSLTHSLCGSLSLSDLADRHNTQYHRQPQYVALVVSAPFATRRSVSRLHESHRECVYLVRIILSRRRTVTPLFSSAPLNPRSSSPDSVQSFVFRVCRVDVGYSIVIIFFFVIYCSYCFAIVSVIKKEHINNLFYTCIELIFRPTLRTCRQCICISVAVWNPPTSISFRVCYSSRAE